MQMAATRAGSGQRLMVDSRQCATRPSYPRHRGKRPSATAANSAKLESALRREPSGEPAMKTALSLLALCLAAGPAAAQELPQKTLTMVVGFVAGGGADTAARIIAKKVGENLKQTVVIDNRAGAGGNLAHQYVATATPDGSTILLGSVGPLAVAPHMMKV